jgi:hypothetical protein
MVAGDKCLIKVGQGEQCASGKASNVSELGYREQCA